MYASYASYIMHLYKLDTDDTDYIIIYIDIIRITYFVPMFQDDKPNFKGRDHTFYRVNRQKVNNPAEKFINSTIMTL